MDYNEWTRLLDYVNAERDAALARAEAAEKELERLTQRYQMAIERAHIAERRVAELEARLIDVDMAQISTANELEAIAASLGLTYDAWPGFAPILQDIEMRLSAQGWRTVTGDDLPEDHDEALVTVTNEDGYRFVDMAEFTVGGVWWQHVDTGWRELKRVTHWRPLPPPPTATE